MLRAIRKLKQMLHFSASLATFGAFYTPPCGITPGPPVVNRNSKGRNSVGEIKPFGQKPGGGTFSCYRWGDSACQALELCDGIVVGPDEKLRGFLLGQRAQANQLLELTEVLFS